MTNNNQECGDCFEAEEDSIDGFELPLFFFFRNVSSPRFVSCSNTFLPTMSNCSQLVCCLYSSSWGPHHHHHHHHHCQHRHHHHWDLQVTDWMDFYSMAVLQCYNNRLQELDWSGEAQKYSFIFRIMAIGQCEVLEDDCTDDEI